MEENARTSTWVEWVVVGGSICEPTGRNATLMAKCSKRLNSKKRKGDATFMLRI